MKKSYNAKRLILLILLFTIFTACSLKTDIPASGNLIESNPLSLIGTWLSESVTVTKDLFQSLKPNVNKYKHIKVLFDNDNQFTWVDFKSEFGEKFTGKYTLDKKNKTLTLSIQDETDEFIYEHNGNKLIIKTNDGFVFTFKKNNKGK